MESNYEPKVVAFACHYCAYSAADLAGSMRIEYAPNVRIVKLMYRQAGYVALTESL